MTLAVSDLFRVPHDEASRRAGALTPVGEPVLLLKFNGQEMGTTRLDVRDDESAFIRLVAVPKTEQGKGHGRILAEMVTNFARQKGVKKFLVNADPNAIGYYEKLGYAREDWDPSELVGISANSVQMSTFS
jgi:N-acetylglutamate synthase-like GNAT family acetyltransferase